MIGNDQRFCCFLYVAVALNLFAAPLPLFRRP